MPVPRIGHKQTFAPVVVYLTGNLAAMKTCITGKRPYPTQAIAEDALIEAHMQYDYGKSTGPVGVYLCEECGKFHLTSQGVMNERLAQLIKEGKIKLAREAGKWADKFRKR
jgi:hypothetical protein